jgi:hypothetical protein
MNVLKVCVPCFSGGNLSRYHVRAGEIQVIVVAFFC